MSAESVWEEFEIGVWAWADLWDVLNTAAEHGWAGTPQQTQRKRQELVSDVLDLFEKKKERTDVTELEMLLRGLLMQDFCVDAQDGSVEHAARLLSTMAFDCFVKQDFQGVQVLEERANQLAEMNRVDAVDPFPVQAESESESEETMQRPEEQDEAEDGWTVVRKK